jgi:hypothetical protein
MDYLDTLLTAEVKSFKAEVNILCNRYLHGSPNWWNALYSGEEIIVRRSSRRVDWGLEYTKKQYTEVDYVMVK